MSKKQDKTTTGFTSRWFGWVARTDRASHGYIPFFCWLCLLFGGIWFPATSALNHIFNDADAPKGVLFGTAVANEASRSESEQTDRSLDRNELSQQATANGDTEKTTGKLGLVTAILLLPLCLLFWAWTNIGLLCLMASAMGEVNRCAEEGALEKTDYRMACTRAFFVYLFVLLNEVAVAGSLTAAVELQGTYTRIAIFASLLSFVASYRPQFYLGLVSKFSAKHQGDDINANSTVTSNESTEQPQPVAAETVSDPDIAESAEDGLAPPEKDRALSDI